jgi:hypothetical protein
MQTNTGDKVTNHQYKKRPLPPEPTSAVPEESAAATASDYLTVALLLVCWASFSAELYYRLHLPLAASLYKGFCCVAVGAFCIGGLWFSKAIFTRAIYLVILASASYGLSLWIL